MKNKYPLAALGLSIIASFLIVDTGQADQHLSAAQLAMTVAERNRVYAPWDPKDMDKLRKEMGLIGPGTRTPYPTARFPDYLKTPESVEELMSQARYAVQQKGGPHTAGPGGTRRYRPNPHSLYSRRHGSGSHTPGIQGKTCGSKAAV